MVPRWLKPCVLAAGCILFACPRARAQGQERPASEARLPGLVSATGLLQMPSAYVQRGGEVTAFAASARGTTGGVLLGLAQRFELSGVVGSADRGGSQTVASAKWNLLPEALLSPALSVGVLDAFDSSREGRSAYVVVSKSVIPYFVEAVTGQRHLALKLHAGYGSGLYHNRPFVGGEVWGQNGIGALGELSAGHVNLGARYTHSGVGITVGLLDLKRVGGSLAYTIPLH